MVDVRERLEAAAARPGRDAPLAQVEQRLQRRRRLRVGGVVAASVLCLGAIGGAVALATDGGGGGVSTSRPVSSASGVTVTLPEWWVEIPAVGSPAGFEADSFRQVYAAGTRAISSVDSCPVVEGHTDDAFITVSELLRSGDVQLVTSSRPADFATAAPTNLGSCTPSSPDGQTEISRTYEFLFHEGGRDLLAGVVIGATTPEARRNEAFAILNSLDIGTSVVSPTVPEPPSVLPVPTVPPTVAESPDTEAVRAVFLGWIDTQPRDTAGRFVEDWESIEDVVMQAAADAPLPLDGYTGRVDAITNIDGDSADVIYSFLNGGAVAVGNLRGRAVKVDGEWKVSRDTACAAIEFGGFTCPPHEG